MPRIGRGIPSKSTGGPHPAVITRSNRLGALLVRTPPTLVSYTETTWTTGSSVKTTASVSWLAGDLIVVLGMTADQSYTLVPTATGLTLVAGTPLTAANSCWANSWSVVASSSGSSVFTSTSNGGTQPHGIGVWVFRGSDGLGVRASDTSTAKVTSLARSGNKSVVVGCLGDWSAAPTTSHVWTPTGQTERDALVDAGNYTVYVANWPDQGAAGTTSYGITGTSSTGTHSKIALEVLGGFAAAVSSPTSGPSLVTPSFVWPTIPKAFITASQPLGNPAAPTPEPLVVGPMFVPAPIPGAHLFGPGAPTDVVDSVITQSALVVSTPWVSTVPEVYLSSSQPLGNPAVPTPEPLVVGPTFVPAPIPRALIVGPGATASTPEPLVVTPPFVPVPVPPVSITASQPLGNPAVGSPDPLVVGVPYTPIPVPGARLSANPAAPVISTTSTPGPLVVTPPFTPVPVPVTYLSASRPLGNPAVGTRSAMVVGPAFVPAAPPRATISSGALTTATGVPLVVVPAFTLAPVPGARVFAGSVSPVVSTIATPSALVVTPLFAWTPIPVSRLSSSQPLGSPAVGTRSAMVVSPLFAWGTVSRSVVSITATHSCTVLRPTVGTTLRPSAGTTVRGAGGTTSRPDSGTTARPDTGTTEDPCS